jgi:hypothetical protein
VEQRGRSEAAGLLDGLLRLGWPVTSSRVKPVAVRVESRAALLSACLIFSGYFDSSDKPDAGR